MSGQTPGDAEEAMDLEIMARDDLLLNALGRGEEAPGDDDLAAILAAWHADVALKMPAPGVLRSSAHVGSTTATDRSRPVRLAARPRLSAPSRRWALPLAAAAVAVIALASGLGVSSRHAGPGSPLWSLTKVLHPQQAEVREVEDRIDRARNALAAGRLDDAQQLMDHARRDLARVADRSAADRFQAQLDALARELLTARADPATLPAATAGAPAPTRHPTTGTSAAKPPPTKPERTAAAGGSPAEETNPVPPLPQPAVPPAPSASQLSPLPGLPLQTGGLGN
ncbi:hypothetical protein ACVCAH_33955 [Micromonospora sp. LZ34]